MSPVFRSARYSVVAALIIACGVSCAPPAAAPAAPADSSQAHEAESTEAPATASSAPSPAAPSSCQNDSDCTLSTFGGCCACCPHVPHAFLKESLARLQAKCETVRCASCDERCGPDVDMSAYSARCVQHACAAVPE